MFDCFECRDTGRVTDNPSRLYGHSPIGKRCPVCSGPREGNAWVAQARRDREAADAAVDAACEAGTFDQRSPDDHTQHGAAGWHAAQKGPDA